MLILVSMMHTGVTERHFKEKLPRVLGLGNTTPDAATMTTAVRGLMFGDYIVPGELLILHVKAYDMAAYNTCQANCLSPRLVTHATRS